MARNRKKSDTYRFNGIFGIKSVEASELKTLIERFKAKDVDSNDRDDKKWTAHWLQRYQQELAKKEKTLEQRQTDAAKRLRKIPSVSEFDANENPNPVAK
jgi:hypothetical protein